MAYTKIDVNDCIEYFNSNDQLHNENGPARITLSNARSWYINGIIHRLDGPAYIECKGVYEWYKNGKLHREDGPAIRLFNLEKQYYLEGIKYNEEEYYIKIKVKRKKIFNKVNHIVIKNKDLSHLISNYF